AWKKLLANRGKRDLYVIREAEGLNFVSGTILNGNEAGDILTFEKEDGAKAELRLSRATGGLVFAQPQPTQIAPTLCKVFDVFGNVLVAQSLEISSAGVVVTTVNGAVVKYPSSKAIAKLDYSQGNVAYLSDLDPQVEVPEIGVDEKGLRLNVTAPFIKNRGLSNEPLKLGSEVFPRGLSIAPDSKLTFNIGGDYREFKAVVGVQENSPDADLEARLIIETEEGRILFSEVLKRKDKPKSVGLDVKGVKQIRIIVEADLPVNGNRVILADARVQK
ncbi:MAG TPA: NPCBM/NEW2 domain-containing protein, partial [Gemmata sp.]|nr:NPCBM/NEW2 domain-containing protein [Gemmata sp.]